MWCAALAARPADDLATARRLLAQGSLDDGIQVLQRVVQANPKDAEACQLLGTSLALVPKRTEALEFLRRAVALRPGYVPGHMALALALTRFGELEEARQSYEGVLALDPRHADAHVRLAMVLAVLGQTRPAVEHLSRAIGLQGSVPEAALTYYLRGKAHTQLELARQAAGDFEKAAQLRPDYAKAWMELGVTRAGLQDDPGALLALRRAAELAPDDAETRYQLGSAYLRSGEADSAVEHLRAAARLRPDDRGTLYALARALQAANRGEEARPLLDRLSLSVQDKVLKDPDVPRAGEFNNQGVELEKAGRHAEALEKYRAALAISPSEVQFRRNLALSLCRLERWDEAVAELRAVLAAAPGDAQATRALYIALDHAKR
jgi:tetratricopeptide (TPR) repeat protein